MIGKENNIPQTIANPILTKKILVIFKTWNDIFKSWTGLIKKLIILLE